MYLPELEAPKLTGCSMRDTIDEQVEELLTDWYAWQSEYRPKLGYGRHDATTRGYQPRWRDSSDLADIAHANARKQVCEAVDACVQRLDPQARVAIQTEMRNRFSRSTSWSSIRLPGTLEEEFARAKEMLAPLFEARDLIEAA
jgi:hypothetical protein